MFNTSDSINTIYIYIYYIYAGKYEKSCKQLQANGASRAFGCTEQRAVHSKKTQDQAVITLQFIHPPRLSHMISISGWKNLS